MWGMLYADDATIVSRSSQEVAKIVAVIVKICQAFGLTLTLSAKKTETICMSGRGEQPEKPDALFYHGVLQLAGCESIEATVRQV